VLALTAAPRASGGHHPRGAPGTARTAPAQLARLHAWLAEHPTWHDVALSGTDRWVDLILRFRFDHVNKER
jgi:hypothetical protein